MVGSLPCAFVGASWAHRWHGGGLKARVWCGCTDKLQPSPHGLCPMILVPNTGHGRGQGRGDGSTLEVSDGILLVVDFVGHLGIARNRHAGFARNRQGSAAAAEPLNCLGVQVISFLMLAPPQNHHSSARQDFKACVSLSYH